MFRSPEPDQVGRQNQRQTETDIKSLCETSFALRKSKMLALSFSHLSRGDKESRNGHRHKV